MQQSQHSLKELTAIALLVAGIVMAFIALFLPPPGEIHESVLFIFAQILIYAGSIFGIDAYIRKSLSPTLPGREGAMKNVTDDAPYHKHQREYEHLQDPEHRRNPNDRGDPEEED